MLSRLDIHHSRSERLYLSTNCFHCPSFLNGSAGSVPFRPPVHVRARDPPPVLRSSQPLPAGAVGGCLLTKPLMAIPDPRSECVPILLTATEVGVKWLLWCCRLLLRQPKLLPMEMRFTVAGGSHLPPRSLPFPRWSRAAAPLKRLLISPVVQRPDSFESSVVPVGVERSCPDEEARVNPNGKKNSNKL